MSMTTMTKIGRSAMTAIYVGARRNHGSYHRGFILMVPARTLNNIGLTNNIAASNIRRRLTSSAKESNRSPHLVKEKTSASVGNETASTTSPAPSKNVSSFKSFCNWYLGPKEMPERWTASWYREMVLVCTVFAITGSSTMVLVRPAVSKGLGLKGSFKDGPWAYRICSLVVMTPIYATLLVFVGTVFGRHQYFRHFSVKMWSRFGIPPEMIDASYHVTKKNFRKW